MGLTWIERDGKRILVTKYGADHAENLRLLQEQGQIERGNSSLLVLSDYNGTSATREYMDAVKAYGKELRTGPTSVKNAVIGITGLKLALFRAYILFTGDRHTRSFDTMEQAVRWLTE